MFAANKNESLNNLNKIISLKRNIIFLWSLLPARGIILCQSVNQQGRCSTLDFQGRVKPIVCVLRNGAVQLLQAYNLRLSFFGRCISFGTFFFCDVHVEFTKITNNLLRNANGRNHVLIHLLETDKLFEDVP